MLDLAVIATTYGLILAGELPDKTAIASLVLGTRYPWAGVFAGVAAAFLTHVIVAVTAGAALGLLPHRLVTAIVSALFLVGAILIWREGLEDRAELEAEVEDDLSTPSGARPADILKVAALAYGVIFFAEWGDLTQILTANLAAKYHNALSVGIGATLGLWSTGLMAILGGRTLLRILPMRWITRIAALVMVTLAVYSGVEVART